MMDNIRDIGSSDEPQSVSKRRLTQEFDQLQLSFGDLYALLLAMKLVTKQFEDNEAERNVLYSHVKQCLFHLAAHNVLTLKLLQAEILVSLYEIGHAIYPAAYLTVGHCVRVAHALNLQDLTTPFRLFPLPSK